MPYGKTPAEDGKGNANYSDNESALKLWYGARKQSTQSGHPGPGPNENSGETQAGMQIAIQGEPGSFSHEAALKLVSNAVIVPFALSAEVFAALS